MERQLQKRFMAVPSLQKQKRNMRHVSLDTSDASSASDESDTSECASDPKVARPRIRPRTRVRARDIVDSPDCEDEQDQSTTAQQHEEVAQSRDKSRRSIVGTNGQQMQTRRGQKRMRTDSDSPPHEYYKGAKPLRIPRAVSDLIEIYETEGRGRGIRTTQDSIPAGTLLFSETAAVRVFSYEDEDDLAFTKRIRGKVASLPPDKLAAFLALAHDPQDDTEEGRFTRNCFEDKDTALNDLDLKQVGMDAGDVDGIFTAWLDMSMINHSCKPNAILLIQDPKGGESMPTANLVTTTDVPVKGTEITISYLRGAEVGCKEPPRHARQHQLFRSWQFHCMCEECSESTGALQLEASQESTCFSDRSETPLSDFAETSDDRMHCIHKLGEDLGVIEYVEGEYRPLLANNFDKLFPQYEALLEAQRLVYPLYDAHNKAIEAYSAEYIARGHDDLIFAKILYHRERLMRLSRICWGNEEAQKCATRYIKELKKEITRPKIPRSTAAVPPATRKSTKRPLKPMPSQVISIDDDSDDEVIVVSSKRRKGIHGGVLVNQLSHRGGTIGESQIGKGPRPRQHPASTTVNSHPPSRNPIKPPEKHMQRAHKSGPRKALKSKTTPRTPHHALAPQNRRRPETHAVRQVPQRQQDSQRGGARKRLQKVSTAFHGKGASREDPIDLDE